MNGTTFSNSYSVGITLDNPSTELPATVTGTIDVAAGPALQGVTGTAWTVVDQGTIASTAGLGVALAGGGTIRTTANALIAGSTAGAYIYGAPGTVTNFGTISGSAGPGVRLGAGGTVVDQVGGQITDSSAGVLISGGAGTVNAYGTIAGTGTPGIAIAFSPGYANLLIDHPNAVFIGTVDGGNPPGSSGASSTLVLASGVGTGTISGIGSQFVDFAQITIDSGAAWIVAGSNTIATGVTLTDAGSLTNAGTLYGVGNAVVLASGASLTNLASGTIAGADSAIYSPTGGSANTVVNAGSLGATAFVGVRLREGGALTNAASGTISGAYAAVYVAGGIGTVTNAGLITAASGYYYSDGVGLFAGGMVSNAASGTITAALKGVAVYGAVGTVANLGTIIGSGFIGVALDAGGAISNAAGGMIGGGYVGIYTGGSASTITNDGSVAAGAGYAISTGIAMYAGGSVSNSAAGGISGVAKGIAIYNAAGTITNLGSIGATGAAGTAVSLAAGFANLLVDEPDGVFIGTVDGGNTIGSSIVSTLEFGSSSLHGTITGLGTQFIDFAQVTVDPGASWTVSGSNSLAGGITLTDRGTLLLNGGTLADAGPATISGTVGEFADVTVAGAGAVWSGSAGLVVGDLGSGALMIGSQGSVTAAAQGSSVAAVLGAGIGSDGALQVVGPGAAFSAAGQLDVGQAGAGHLRVQNQGTVQTGGNPAVDALQGFDIAQAAGGLGDAVVAGSLSLLSNTGRFVVGDAGFGSLAIEAGGTVITTPGTVAGLAGAVIGAQAGADGSAVNVAGAGSNWRITGTLQVGDAAAGSLAIAGGGTVSAGALDAGAASGSSGDVSVVGSGSGLALGSQLTVGDAGSAELAILAGGMVSADNADIGVQAGSTGNVDIEGVGSHLDIANDLTIGVAGVGVLTLGAGTELTVVNNLVVGANGVLNQFGGVIDPSTITIVAGGRQGGHGTTTASVEISNAGTLFASSGIETVNTPLITAPSGKSGVLEIDAVGDLVLNAASVDATQSVTFTDGTGILTIGTIGGFGGTIASVTAGDEIIVQGTSIASDSFDPATHVLTLFDAGNATIGALQLGALVNGATLLANGTGGIGVAPCFVAGTRISTDRGEVAVEDLRIGDRVQAVAQRPLPGPAPHRGRGLGRGPAQPVIWIGHRTVDCARHPQPRKVWPVRIAAGAFGPNRPTRNLFLSPDHALYTDDVLIPVKHLINGTTIVQTPVDTVTYFHVELPEHAVLLADNLPAESYLDAGDRANFANALGPIALYPDFASRVWDAAGCAPLVVTGGKLDAIRQWVDAIAATRVIPQPMARFG